MRKYIDFLDIKATVKLSIPLIVGYIAFNLMGMTDTFFVKSVGDGAIGSLGLANATIFLIISFAFPSYGMLSSFVAKAKEEGNNSKIKSYLVSGGYVSLVTFAVLGLLCFLITYHFEWLGQPEQTNIYAREYMYIIVPSLLPMFLFYTFKSIVDGMDHTKIGMYISLIGVILNIFLDYALVEGHWGFPALGIAGTAIATSLIRCFMLIAIVVYIFKNKSFKPILAENIQKSVVFKSFKELLINGIPSGFQSFSEMALFEVGFIAMGWISIAASDAHQIAMQIISMTFIFTLGLASATSIRIGEALGLKNLEMLKKSIFSGLMLSSCIMFICSFLILLLKANIIAIFTATPETIAIASSILIFASFFQLADGLQVVAIFVLRALKDIQITKMITATYWFLGIPLLLILGFFFNMHHLGIWLSFLITLALAALLLCYRIYKTVYVIDNLDDILLKWEEA